MLEKYTLHLYLIKPPREMISPCYRHLNIFCLIVASIEAIGINFVTNKNIPMQNASRPTKCNILLSQQIARLPKKLY